MKSVDDSAARRRLGELLRQARQTAGLTVASVASTVEVNKSTVSRWEMAKVTPKDDDTLNSVYELLKAGLDENNARSEFLTTAEGLGYVLDFRPLTLSRQTLSDQYSAEPIEFLRVVLGLTGPLSLERIKAEVALMQPMNRAGLSIDALKAARTLITQVERSNWAASPDGSEALSLLYKAMAELLVATSPVENYGNAIGAAEQAMVYANDHGLPARTRDQLWSAAAYQLGNTARVLEDAIRQRPTHALRTLLKQALSNCIVHPLEEALRTEDIEVRLWARTERIKKFAYDDWSKTKLEFDLALRELASHRTSQTFAMLPIPGLLYEGMARSIILRYGWSDDAKSLLEMAKLHGGSRLTSYQTNLSEALMLLKSSKRGLVNEGREQLKDLIAAPADAHQLEKALDWGKSFGLSSAHLE